MVDVPSSYSNSSHHQAQHLAGQREVVHSGCLDEGFRCRRVVEAHTEGAGCWLAQKTQESVGEHPHRHTYLEEANAVRDPPRAADVVESMTCLLGVADNTKLWEMVEHSFLRDKAAASHRRMAAVAPLQAALQDLRLAVAVVQTHQKGAYQGGHLQEQPTQARKLSWTMMKLAGRCTRYPSFCSLYTFHPESDYSHCIGSKIIPVSKGFLVYNHSRRFKSGLVLTLRFLQ